MWIMEKRITQPEDFSQLTLRRRLREEILPKIKFITRYMHQSPSSTTMRNSPSLPFLKRKQPR